MSSLSFQLADLLLLFIISLITAFSYWITFSKENSMKGCATIKICGVTHVRIAYQEKGYQLFLVFSRNYYIQKTMIT